MPIAPLQLLKRQQQISPLTHFSHARKTYLNMPNHDLPSGTFKRRRTLSLEDNSRLPDESAQPLIRSDIWLDDGSVVIQAELTQFRVHRTMLTRRSSVFRDMFSVPQPCDSGPSVEGCPIVHLSDDAQDVTYILSALYDQNYTSRDIIPFPVVAAMLRLGSKYDFDHLRREALFRLRAEFPSTLQKWEVLPSEYSHMQNQGGILFDIINLALEQGIVSILPVAYYLCIQDIDEIFSGQNRDDGSVASLPPVVQKACFQGREKILIAQADNTLAWLENEPVSTECYTTPTCTKVCNSLISCFWKPVPEPCRSLEKWAQVPLKEGLCDACTEEAGRIHEEGRQKMWDIMPLNFGFPAWEELKTLDR